MTEKEVQALEQWACQRATYYEGQPAAQAYHDVLALCETVRAEQVLRSDLQRMNATPALSEQPLGQDPDVLIASSYRDSLARERDAARAEARNALHLMAAWGCRDVQPHEEETCALCRAEHALEDARAEVAQVHEALESAWDLAEHANRCRECGDMSWDTCQTGTELYQQARQQREALNAEAQR